MFVSEYTDRAYSRKKEKPLKMIKSCLKKKSNF